MTLEELMDRPSLRLLIGKENLVGAEIGVYKGRNALEILDNLDIKKIYLIDNWGRKYGGEEKCKRVLKDHLNKIVWLKARSEMVYTHIEDGELDFAYVDGGHKVRQVAKDLEVYFPKVKKGGLMCGHDYQRNIKLGVRKAVNRFFKEKNLKIHSGMTNEPRKAKNYDWWVWKK